MKRQFSRSASGVLFTPARAVIGAVALLVFVLGMVRVFAPDALVALASPLWSAGNLLTAAVGNSGARFENAEVVRVERDTLREQVVALQNENLALKERARDLERLSAEESSSGGGIRAGVLARPPISPYDSLVIGKGRADGVLVGEFAYGPGGVPVGKVGEMGERTARVVLFSSPGIQTDGWVGEVRTAFTLTGTGGGSFSAVVSKDAPVVIGDPALVPGPGALVIGTVARIDTDPSSPTETLYIRPLVNPFSLTWVVVGS